MLILQTPEPHPQDFQSKQFNSEGCQESEHKIKVPKLHLDAVGDWNSYEQVKERPIELYVENIPKIIDRGYEELDNF